MIATGMRVADGHLGAVCRSTRSAQSDVTAAVAEPQNQSIASTAFGCLNPLIMPIPRRLPKKTSWESNPYVGNYGDVSAVLRTPMSQCARTGVGAFWPI
jgi:hypothetical protein